VIFSTDGAVLTNLVPENQGAMMRIGEPHATVATVAEEDCER